jgi:hypothetical protein
MQLPTVYTLLLISNIELFTSYFSNTQASIHGQLEFLELRSKTADEEFKLIKLLSCFCHKLEVCLCKQISTLKGCSLPFLKITLILTVKVSLTGTVLPTDSYLKELIWVELVYQMKYTKPL